MVVSAGWSQARDLTRLCGAETRSASGPTREWFDRAPPYIEVEEDAVEMGSYRRVPTLLLAPGAKPSRNGRVRGARITARSHVSSIGTARSAFLAVGSHLSLL